MNKNYRKKAGNPGEIIFEVNQPCQLLSFLLLNVRGKSRNNIKSILSHGEVLVDDTVETQFDYSLQPGQKICIVKSSRRGKSNEESPDIIYEDDDFIVINKPSGLVSVATDKERHNTAYRMVLRYLRYTGPKNRIFVVHRLDRDTPGDGLEAVTEYKVLKENKDYSMLEVQLKTGRKNQIRVHMKDLGHSVAGDKKYGATTNPLNRLGLHACKLTLLHPFSNKVLSFSAQIPDSFNKSFKF